jgi:hypothetical protein
MHTGLQSENSKERESLRELDVDGKTTFMIILKKQGLKM